VVLPSARATSRSGDQELQVEGLAQVEENAEVVVRQPVRLVEEEEAK
jgi:hypothetical protein